MDSNVLVAAFATRGLCDAILTTVLKSHRLLVSEPLLAEVEKALADIVRVPIRHGAETLKFIRLHSTLVDPAAVDESACRDPTDLHVLGGAVAGHAEVIVTGDKDLLVLGKFRLIPILSPREFWQLLAK